jgi:sialate O-acetylesterase
LWVRIGRHFAKSEWSKDVHSLKQTPKTEMSTHSSWYRTVAPAIGLVFSIFPVSAISQQALFRIAPLFTDAMVLQQRSATPIWGRGTPGTMIKVQASWRASASTLVGPDSTWILKVRTPKAGGPYQVTIMHDDTTLVLKNVLVGEVWLCSGQSNMEMPLAGWPPSDTVLNSAQEIEHSNIFNVRLFAVGRAFSAVPEFACEGTWTESSSATSRDFSATAYFFGKKLYETLHVPIGLIRSCWGGTRIESWIDAHYLSQIPAYDTSIRQIRASADGQRQILSWLHQYPVVDMRSRKGEARWTGLSFQDTECANRSYNDSSWLGMKLPMYWERTSVGEFDGVVWFRKQVTVPVSWLRKALVLELGPVDDIDVTYVNGVKVGGHEAEGQWNVNRVYDVSAELIDSTIVQIAVRVIDYQGGGGFYGDPKSMVLHPKETGESIQLAGNWKYVPVAEYLNNTLYVFGPSGQQYETRPHLPIDLSANTPTALYNAMISPLVPYSIRGVIWYQGESNTDNPKLYGKLFPLMIENWRSNFKVGEFPFYFAQIAPWNYGPSSHSELLREAQTATLDVKNTGMAVLLDVGNPTNIHPANKPAVGERLALWALAKTYKENVAYSGPIFKSARKVKEGIEVSFRYADKGLVLIGGTRGNGFQIAGADHVFRSANVVVRGSKLLVSNPDVPKPEAVRYAFSNTPDATLFNTDGLPASSFRTDSWE